MSSKMQESFVILPVNPGQHGEEKEKDQEDFSLFSGH